MVKDAAGCTALGNNNLINQPSKIRITNYDYVDVSGCSGNTNGRIAVEATGGTGLKNYSLDGGIPIPTGIFIMSQEVTTLSPSPMPKAV